MRFMNIMMENFMLADGYYDNEVGVVDEPIMQTLLF